LGQFVGPPHVPVVVAHGLFHQTVLARLQGREDQILMVAPGHHVHHIDVVPGQDLGDVGVDVRNPELGSGRVGQVPMQIADGHHLAQG